MQTDAKALTRDLHIKAPLTFPEGTPDGTFLVRFSTFNHKDLQGEIVLPGAIPHGQETALIWGHIWESLPVGKGITEVDQMGADLRGNFFLDTPQGDAAYRTIKAMGDLQEFSWGFKVLDAYLGEQDGEQVRYIKQTELYEVSAVLIGANRETGVLAIKAADPTPHERFADQLERVLSELTAVQVRATALLELRVKEGRTFSSANFSKLSDLSDQQTALGAQLRELLDSAEPKKSAEPDEMLGLWFEEQRYLRRRRVEGVA